jgi:hypothetical protein
MAWHVTDGVASGADIAPTLLLAIASDNHCCIGGLHARLRLSQRTKAAGVPQG